MSENKEMLPMSGEKVETDGTYVNPWGREELLKRGELFPADVMMGDTEWRLISLPSDTEFKKIHDIQTEEHHHQTRFKGH
jgi:hypothetical protein